jgi:hypothetical protein
MRNGRWLGWIAGRLIGGDSGVPIRTLVAKRLDVHLLFSLATAAWTPGFANLAIAITTRAAYPIYYLDNSGPSACPARVSRLWLRHSWLVLTGELRADFRFIVGRWRKALRAEHLDRDWLRTITVTTNTAGVENLPGSVTCSAEHRFDGVHDTNSPTL